MTAGSEGAKPFPLQPHQQERVKQMSARTFLRKQLHKISIDNPVYTWLWRARGRRSYARWLKKSKWSTTVPSSNASSPPSALRDFFESRTTGPGIWKWNHYFDVYERHLSKFRNSPVGILEIGIYSGGSLELWRSYFGEKSRVYGVDLLPECMAYERDGIRVFIGDQADRKFWGRVKGDVAQLDVVIDDGGHLPRQQMVTLEELLPHLRPGGIYICEDIHHDVNAFTSYVHQLTNDLNAFEKATQDTEDPARRLACKSTNLQSAVASIHFYPFLVVIEKTSAPIREMIAPMHGSEWQPFSKIA